MNNKIVKATNYFLRCGIANDTMKYINKVFSNDDSKKEFYEKCLISVSEYIHEIDFNIEVKEQLLNLYPNVNEDDIKGMKFDKEMMLDCIITKFLEEKMELIENKRKNLQKQVLSVF